MPTPRLLAILALVSAACSPPPPTSPMPATSPASPAMAMPQTDGIVRQLRGQVRQRLEAGYLYLEVEDALGDRHWVVSLMKDVALGADVEVKVFGSRDQFFSKRLQRRFDTLSFGVVRVR